MVSSRPPLMLACYASRATSHMQSRLYPVDFVDQGHCVAHQRLVIAVFSALLSPIRRDHRLAGRVSAAIDLGGFCA